MDERVTFFRLDDAQPESVDAARRPAVAVRRSAA
jgi:hypothetical protein